MDVSTTRHALSVVREKRKERGEDGGMEVEGREIRRDKCINLVTCSRFFQPIKIVSVSIFEFSPTGLSYVRTYTRLQTHQSGCSGKSALLLILQHVARMFLVCHPTPTMWITSSIWWKDLFFFSVRKVPTHCFHCLLFLFILVHLRSKLSL